MRSTLDGRLNRLEQAQLQDCGDKIVYTGGAEYGLDPVQDGWAVIVQDGHPVQAWQKDMWDAWDEQGAR